MLTVRIAGCALIVSLRSGSGPSKHSLLNAKPRISSARRKTRRAVSDTSQSALPMPTYWEPCPGNTKATARPADAPSPFAGGSGRGRELPSLGDRNLSFHVVPGFADRPQLLRILIGDLHAVLLLEGHDQLDQVE